MRAKSAILELGARFGIETPHTKHVTHLALELFDGLFSLEGLKRSDRSLLFAAASLHDIAYATDPENHVYEGARILAENPVEGFTTDEWRSVIGIVLLHKRNWRAVLDHELFPVVGDKELLRIKRLAAILRIADGLDHSHIQDAKILYCRHGRKVDKVGVECSWYAGNIPWAEAKSDLWEAVFKRGFRIDGTLKQHKKMFNGVVRKRDSAVAAARRLLYSQWCIMRDNVSGMLKGDDLECLHVYRVAMRRFRTALRMFRPLLSDTNARELDDRLTELSDKLSPVRDTHVAFQFFQSLESAGNQYPEIMQALQLDVMDANQTLKVVLESDFCLQTVQVARRFLRVELPDLARDQAEPLFVDFAQEQLIPLIKRITETDVVNLREGDPAHMHQVRKRCRRGRYYAEFAAPVLGRETKQAAKYLKTVAAALGDVRDTRALLRRFEKSDAAVLIRQRENESWARFAKGWQRLCGG